MIGVEWLTFAALVLCSSGPAGCGGGGALGGDAGSPDPAPTGRWRSVALEGAPSPRYHHTAVWTGTEMIVWGGQVDTAHHPDGARYSPDTDTWRPMAAAGAPAGSTGHTAVWTGSEMIIWGGAADRDWRDAPQNTGARYDPISDSWSPMSTAGAPEARTGHGAVWTGSEMVVWGGLTSGTSADSVKFLGTAGRYDPTTDSWAPVASSSYYFSTLSRAVVWTGAELIFWGLPVGVRYDLAANTWTPMSTTAAPTIQIPDAVWTGHEMIVWDRIRPLNGGARYDPATDRWTTMTGASPTGYRASSSPIWADRRLIVWGGDGSDAQDRLVFLSTGGVYDPSTDSWATTASANVASARSGHTAVWTGREMIVWGGGGGNGYLNTGGRFTP